ncbi:hypothetical protein C8F01DRAFT_515025 [Mycena amicta]|nr:hypothetical protein C8F01DRAFT_515025 [Mycena amicta]
MSAPFARHFNTNYCPTDDELAEIKALLVEPHTRLRTLDETIQKLQEERDKLAAHIATYQALISPMRRVPHDVLQEIFLECLPKNRNCAMSAFEAPVLLARICGEWRSLAFQTPALWSRLHIVEPVTSPWISVNSLAARKTKMVQRLSAVKVWLSRSGQCPLSISLRQNEAVHRFTHLDIGSLKSELFSAIIPYASRWNKIELSLPLAHEPETFNELAQLTTAAVPLLRSFSLDLDRMGNVLAWQSLQLLGATRLESLSLQLDTETAGLLHLPVKWDHLTDLRIFDSAGSRVSVPNIIGILSRCSRLRKAAIKLDGLRQLNPAAAPLQSAELVICGELRILEFSGPDTATSTALVLGHMVCPELRKLDLKTPLIGHEPILHLLSTAPMLETLRFLTGIGFSKRDLLLVVDSLPSTILHLQITDSPSDPQLDDEVMSALTSANHLPRLQSLVLRNCEKLRLSEDGIVAFLRQRTMGVPAQAPSFQRLQVGYSPAPWPFDSQSIYTRIQPFIELGIKVVIHPHPSHGVFSPFEGIPMTKKESERVGRRYWFDADADEPE